MKNRKWILSVAMLLLAAMVLMACGADKTADGTQPSTYEEDPTATTAATEAVEDVDVQIGVGQRGDYDQEETEAAQTGDNAVATTPEQTNPADTTPVDTKPADTKPEESQSDSAQATQPAAPEQSGEELPLTYDQYMAMTEQEQEDFVKSFATLSDFVDWWNAARAQQEKEEPTQIEGNVIDLGDLIP